MQLVIRMAYSQAYRPQANGRAEAAGKSLKSMLRKLAIDQERINWVEALPRVLYHYHNTVGECGVTPYQMEFGRDRQDVGLRLEDSRECESAAAFFSRMEELDRAVAKTVRDQLVLLGKRVNRQRKPKSVFKEGDWVWYLRPQTAVGGVGLSSWWLGPCKVVQRKGKSAYQILVKPGVVQDVHRDQLRTVIRPWVIRRTIDIV